MSDKEPMQLTDLPWEDIIFRHIFPRLPVADLCRLQEVSKGFQQLYIGYMPCCEKLDLSGCTMTNDSMQKVTELCESLRWLSLARCSWVKDSPLMALFKKNSRLIYINLCGCNGLTGAALQILVVNCKKLETLLVADCSWLNLGCWQALIQHQSQLRHINTASCWDVDDRTLQGFFHKFNKLKVVEMDKMELITDTNLYQLAINCPCLERLSVAGCWRITDNGLKKMLDYCKLLRVLDVRFCRRLTEQYLCSLYVRGIHIISDYSLAHMVKRRKRVNQLGINVQI